MQTLQKASSRLFKQRLFRGHVSLGIILSLFLYVSVFFGIFAIFLPYIQQWERPSRHFKIMDITTINYEPMLATVLADPEFPKDGILIELPGFMEDPALKIGHQFTGKTLFNPSTLKKLNDEGNRTGLAMFLNGLHYGRPLQKLGLLLFGFLSVGTLFLILGGLLLIYLLPFNGSAQTPYAVFSRWHRKLFTWGTPLFLIVVICGSVMCLSFDGSGPMTSIITNGAKTNIRPVIGPVLFPEDTAIEKSGKTVPMLPISALIKTASEINPRIVFQKITLFNWGDRTATIKLEGYDPHQPFLNGITNKPAIVLAAHDGSLLIQTRVFDRPWSVLLTDFFYSLHLLFGMGLFLRLFIFVIMSASCLAIVFGVLLHLEKKARLFGNAIPFYHWLEKLSLATMIGVIPATGLVLNLQWLLPFNLPDRLIWQQGLFFDAWLATLAWSFYRINTYRAAKEFLALGGILFLTAPLLHAVTTGFWPFELLQQKLWSIAGVSVGLCICGILFLLAARLLPVNREEAGQFKTGTWSVTHG